jgi:tRNA threonylcarbamoyladenosine biosynthesis protein TsaE
MKQTLVYSVDELPSVVKKLKNFLKSCAILTLTGPLGVGKTTLIKELLKSLGVKDRITSPTFMYVNRYDNDKGQTLYHFDLYRIKSLQDFMHEGFQEYLYQPDSLVLIEWPELIQSLLTHDVCQLDISYHEDPSKRVLSMSSGK